MQDSKYSSLNRELKGLQQGKYEERRRGRDTRYLYIAQRTPGSSGGRGLPPTFAAQSDISSFANGTK